MQAHPLCAECLRFQPTLPARGATRRPDSRTPGKAISTHAPRTGSDTTGILRSPDSVYFNPRSPHGERPIRSMEIVTTITFQPTLPARGATCYTPTAIQSTAFQPTLPARGATGADRHYALMSIKISTHAPRTGSDRRRLRRATPPSGFQPTLPARGATRFYYMRATQDTISTHAPRTGSDCRE